MEKILILTDKMVEVKVEPKLPEIDWDFERREEARLDAMYEDRYSSEDE